MAPRQEILHQNVPSTRQDCARENPLQLLLDTSVWLSRPPKPFVIATSTSLKMIAKLFSLLLFAIIFIFLYAVYLYSLPWLWLSWLLVFLQVQRLRGLLGDALPVPSFDRYNSCARSTLKTESFTYTIPNAKHENGHFD